MKLYSQSLELKAIRSMAVETDLSKVTGVPVSSLLLSMLNENFFHYEPCKAAYKRLSVLVQKRSQLVDFHDLVEDPSLNEEYRDILKSYKKGPITDTEQATNLVDRLEQYRKTRVLYHMSKKIIDTLTEKSIDIENLVNFASQEITEARSRESLADQILSVGKGGNAIHLAREAMSMEDDILLTTGFKEFDKKSGGIPAEGVFLIAATTSGGKSTLRMNLMKNLYLLNSINVLTVSLEQNARKETRRMLSSMTSIPYWKFTKKRLSSDEKKLSRKKWKQFHEFGKENDCKFGMLCPKSGLTIDQVFVLVKPFKYKVVCIDYISLLEGVDDKDQWRVLGSIARKAKIFTEQNRCLVILLAQLDSEDDRIRYSRAMTENADCVWVWNYSKPEVRERKILPIRQLKARDSDLYPFDLKENFAMMQILNMDDDITEAESDSDVEIYDSKNGHLDDVEEDTSIDYSETSIE